MNWYDFVGLNGFERVWTGLAGLSRFWWVEITSNLGGQLRGFTGFAGWQGSQTWANLRNLVWDFADVHAIRARCACHNHLENKSVPLRTVMMGVQEPGARIRWHVWATGADPGDTGPRRPWEGNTWQWLSCCKLQLPLGYLLNESAKSLPVQERTRSTPQVRATSTAALGPAVPPHLTTN